MSIWDFGGQYSFRVAHAILFRFSLTVFIFVTKLRSSDGSMKEPKDVRAELRHWLAFIKSSRKTVVSGIKVIVIGNKHTGAEPDNDPTPSVVFRSHVKCLVKEFEGIFDLAGVYELDCMKRDSKAMRLFLSQLETLRNQIIEVIF